MNTVDVGENYHTEVRFTDNAGDLADPTTVTLEFTDPSGNTTTVNQPSLTNSAVGVWSYDIDVDEAGLWTVEWTGDGNGVDQVITSTFLAGEGLHGPCETWVDPDYVIETHTDASTADPLRLARACLVASDVLFAMSGRQFPGHCRETVRPCVRRIAEPWSADERRLAERVWPSGRPVPACGCQRGRRCGCSTLDEVRLGGWPIQHVHEVRVDGSALAASAYRIDDSQFLVRIDGMGWPCCQDLTADPAADGNTFSVDYTYGRQPPESGRLAAATLAFELARSGTGDCQLPRGVQTVTRQGVTVSVVGVTDALDQGRFGIVEIDQFLNAYNPNRLQRRAAVVSPDIGRRVRRTG